jgi:predicted MPP superfamily phosphohydrolase
MTHKTREQLEKRLGRVHARLRMGIEADFEARVFGHGINFFHIENWYSIHSVIRNSLRMTGLYNRGQNNTLDIQVRHHDLALSGLPKTFEGYRILHISDLHVDRNIPATDALIRKIRDIDYDLCVLTGDYRGKTFGPYDAALNEMRRVRQQLGDTVYAVLGNHDTIQMVPELEDMGIQLLLNESTVIERGGEQIFLAGIDDAHYYRVDNIEKAAHDIPEDGFSILLSHTPEIYKQAAHAAFKLTLCGHTHGGQICLPGGIPVTLDSRCPRHMGSGPWQYQDMVGYTTVGAGTSVVSVRLNCPPEVVVHQLRSADD